MSPRSFLVALASLALCVAPVFAQDAPDAAAAPREGAPEVPATTQAAEKTPAQQRDEDFQETENGVRFYPSQPIESFADVLTLKLKENDLQLLTPLRSTPNELRLVDEDRPRSIITVYTEADGTKEKPAEPRTFRFSEFDYNQSDTRLVNREVLYSPGDLAIARVTETDGTLENVQLKQSGLYLLEDGGEGDKVKLFVQVIDDNNPDANVNLVLSARDFVTLRQKYPTEVSQYLEPVFRELGQSSVLYHVDPRAAWQVLAGDFEPTDELNAKLDATIKQLDADEPRARAEASKQLEALGQPAALALMQQDRSKLSAEQINRIDTFLTSFKPLTEEEAERLSKDPQFLALTLTADDPALRALALDALKQAVDKPIDFDLKAAPAARFEAAMKLRDALAPQSTQPATTRSPGADVPPDLLDARP